MVGIFDETAGRVPVDALPSQMVGVVGRRLPEAPATTSACGVKHGRPTPPRPTLVL